MPQIRPITDLRKTSEISELCYTSNEPIFITKNGYGDLVVMSIETYNRKLAMAELSNKLYEAEEELAKNRGIHPSRLLLIETPALT